MKVKKIRENAHTFEEVSKKRLQNSQNQKKYTKNRKKSHILQHLSQFLNKKMHLNRALRSILSVQSRASFFLLLREGESKSKQGMNFWYLFNNQQVSKFRLTCMLRVQVELSGSTIIIVVSDKDNLELAYLLAWRKFTALSAMS